VFDIGFSEIVVCAIVALLVIGPERMPETVRTIGLWIGRFKRSLHETRTEIERQIGVDDIRRQLHNEDIMRSIEAARANMDELMAQTQANINAIEHEYQSEPDLPYHAHGETDSTLEHLAEALVEDSPALQPTAAPAAVTAPAYKVQLEKRSASNPESATASTPAAQPHHPPSDSKAAL
jgi:sec-independent protein translocase protein TatB